MHISRALDLHWARRARPSATGAGIGSLRPRLCLCFPWSVLGPEVSGSKFQVWCLLSVLVTFAVVCIGMFEATRLSTHVMRSPCMVLASEIIDTGTCTLCDDGFPANCEDHPIATARLSVSYKPIHGGGNVTGSVWFCKDRTSSDPCQQRVKFLDQLSLDMHGNFNHHYHPGGPVPCTTGQLYAYLQMHAQLGQSRDCYYSSRDPKGENVWLTMPSPGLVDHEWFQKHLEYPVLLALGGLILLSVLLGCLALEGAELWASGLV
mmetsp:Transcript_53014/g.119417  ORF Transcript_53014/g.119417 Transcript_53014/m.119417 type:complete len:263 (+) Transcript_53014:112-900(+)